MSVADFLIVGGGVASAHAIETLLQHGVPGSDIVLVTADREFPYHRPPLSKGYLLDRESRDSVFVQPPSFYEGAGVAVRRDACAKRLETTNRIVHLSSGETIVYEKLLIATGCVPRLLTVPGSNLPGIHYLRSLAESDALKDHLRDAKTAVVVGGSFIGMELASACAQKGIKTTLLHRSTMVFDKLGSEEASTFFASYFSERGVTVRLEDEAAAFEAAGSSLRVLTKRGDTVVADVVAVGVGVVPSTDWLQDSGVPLNNGVVTNEYLETAVPGVSAAGDVANFFDPLYGRQRRIEHWDTAIQHGKIAGTNMAATDPAQRKAYNLVSYFFSDVFDLSFDYFGDPAGTARVVTRGSFADRAVTLFFLDAGGIVRAAFTMGRPKERKALVELLRSRRVLEKPERLTDTSTPLEFSPQPPAPRIDTI